MKTNIKINDKYIQKILLGSTPVNRIYQSGSIVYEAGVQPTPQPCFEVVDTISKASGDYVDVYVKGESKWYKRNNLNQYEEYGLMPIVSDLSSTTYYTGKLVVLSTDGHEYKWNGSEWIDLGNAGTVTDCIWLDPASNNSSYQIGYYWGTGYKMVFNVYLSESYGSDTAGFLNCQNQSPLEFNFYSNGFYLDMHDPQSTSNNSCYSGDYSDRLMKTSVLQNYQSEQVINFTVTYGTVKAELEEGGTLIGTWGTERTGQSWYNGLYSPSISIGSAKPYHLSRIQVYDKNNNLVNDLKFVENEGETGSQKLSMYDSVLDVKYENTNSNTPTYHISKKGELNPPVDYDEKVAPADNVHYNTLADLELMECPWIGMTATVGNDYTVYVYKENGWVIGELPLDLPYLKFTATENTEITFSQDGLDYSIDGGAWKTMTANIAASVSASSYIIFRGECTPTSSNGIGTFSATGKFNVSGNIMSLLFGDDFTDKVSLAGKDYAFHKLFFNNTKVVDATNLVMPATILSDSCYRRFFSGCSSLNAVSHNLLPATTLTNYCYAEFFYNCSSLTESPLLPAINLAPYCYYTAFQSCRLSKLPELPATIMVEHCYDTMFNYVNTSIPDNYLPSTQLAPYCYAAMFANAYYREKTMSILPATTLASHCYDTMFINNDSITEAPILPAETLVYNSYSYILFGCNKLSKVVAKFTTTPSSSYTYNWLPNITATFYKNPNATWDQEISRNNSTVPSNWTITDIPTANYLKFTTVDENGSTYAFSKSGLEYSINGGEWTTLTANTNTPNVPKDSNIRFRGNLTPNGSEGIGTFSSSGKFDAEGELMTLLYGEYYVGQTGKFNDYAFKDLFINSNVVDASNIILPNVSYSYLYQNTFRNCVYLTSSPAMPSASCSWRMYSDTYNGCTSLVNVGKISAYNKCSTEGACGMFKNCTSLVSSPVIIMNAQISAFYQLFDGCSNLSEVTYLGTTSPSSINSSNWLRNVQSTGTFYMNQDATWDSTVTRDANGIPEGWNIVKVDPNNY